MSKKLPRPKIPSETTESNVSNTSEATPKKKNQQTPPDESLALGQYAVEILQQEYKQLTKQEKSVLADKDPEHLHQMRVSSRRLYTALQIFETAIELPKAASPKRVRTLTRVLGQLRDLDVQLQALSEEYLVQLDSAEQKQLTPTLERLKQKRKKALAGTRDTLSQSRYCDLKTAFESWFAQPRFTLLGNLPIKTILPDLLSPLLSESLLHPAWLIAAADITEDNVVVLHDLRKSCKHVRYQAEFFVPFYGEAFKSWIKDLKILQDNLGSLQDIEVLKHLLYKQQMDPRQVPQLQQIIQDKQAALLSKWDVYRQPYLKADFRYQLHQMLLAPT
ncbi:MULTISPECIES: CHAD domain-containing protein [unclassified Leptolyngbya]|uniref:CHAD domain-containing protein n=1 Tax=unclassified Leptolyngbya TaxID=2650499 RepID=UPI0016889F64|nr:MULTISPECIES: CHAD domain-containing protein [unclassified Leptolyngbya]MBD1910456.1 CHAD domain-containing protein [Leptolyngbya sp. FACHB-8]MBD2153623.1 CHAD domain-containing protein [Leptolyngbya sp. FACHB-16]